jgi:type IV pilus assembly protein PilC
MAVYEYTARDAAGNELSGTYDGITTVAALRDELAKMDYVLLKARKRRTNRARIKKVKQSEVVAFVYKFAEMYSAGLSITRSLETLHQQTENPDFRNAIAEIRQDIEAGSSLEKAFAKYSYIFSDFLIGMLAAGESSGRLGQALEMSAAYLEKTMDLRRKVKSAFAYPVVVCVVCSMVVGGLLGFVVPVFTKLYKQMRVPLPGPTQTLVQFSLLVRDYWWAIPFALVGTALLLRRFLRDPRVRARLDVLKLSVPVFGKLNRMVVASRFTRTFSMLASVGVPLIKALDVAAAVAHNHKMNKIARELQVAIEAGTSVGESFRNYDIFPPMIPQLALSGDEAGELPEMLSKGADFLDKDIERMVSALMIKLEPVLTLIMGIIVGFILVAVYLPMLDYMRHLK